LTISRALSEWWLWAVLTPIVVWLARRYPLHGPRRLRHLPVHVAAGAAIALAKTATDRATYAMLTGFWPYWLASTLALHFFVYAAVVAAAHGIEYYRRSHEREQLEARLAETRLQLLSMQLQPHFLFNTLNTIAELVHDDPDTADRMITGLSDLLRRTLDVGAAQEIPLRDELGLLETYLDIQRIRFGDRLDVDVRAPDAIGDIPVPVLLLQPLVENAIRHGLAVHAQAGRIQIDARQSGAALLIDIVNDGPAGVLPPGSRPPPRGGGVGLGNTQARLEALYGAESHLELTRLAGGGARVSVRIPLGGASRA
jgi:LytS/YehU family sensor histidine kinase